ncbi:AI-2E family transporter [Flavobacterium agrisoli]|uniref:AI-2E family transporter n=1 Tax=Flavobacterium agrisoli TaxID=2793066 RepID=A0A934PKI8_9FLAO|nr:AI-2E family transporter [Flavobacterium agrisoli]MBK0368980.1 AI-2E family transporter [Flavobacterium agrisoli]
MTTNYTPPLYIKIASIFITLLSIGLIFFIGRNVLKPVLLAFLFAVLLLPIHSFLRKKLKLYNTLASLISVLFFVAVVIGILTFISFQISAISSDFDIIQKNFNSFLYECHKFIKEHFKVSIWEQKKYLEDVTKDSVKKGNESIGTMLVSVTDVLLDSTLIPIYTFLFLLYKDHFILFLSKLFKKENHAKLKEILCQIKISINNYILGLLLEMVAVSVLTSAGLYFIGIKYFILLGLITGILNMIPYIGIVIAGVLTVIASLSGTPQMSVLIGILVVNIVVQLLDNNILVPLIINSKVEINALVSIIGIIVGGATAGIAGMFLAIPLLAILKIIFDRLDGFEPWGYLMGNHLPKKFIWKIKSNKNVEGNV